MSTLFVSHSARDNAIAVQTVRLLTAYGYDSLFLDIDPLAGIPPGADWEQDIYSKLRSSDAVVFLCSPHSRKSAWCFAEIALARADRKPIFPILISGRLAHPLLRDRQWIRSDTVEGAVDRLVAALTARGFGPDASFDWHQGRPPYPGLRHFEAQDAAVFKGRDEETRLILDRLRPPYLRETRRALTVVGPSGSGKSSLIRAGIMPRLAKQGEWSLLAPMTPQAAPIEHLAKRLSEALERSGHRSEWESLEASLRTEPSEAVNASRAIVAASGASCLLLLVDQAEELLTQTGDEDRIALARILDAMSASDTCWVILVFRSEFLTDAFLRPELTDLLANQVIVGPMPRSRMHEAIAMPAARVGLSFETGLVGRIVEDTAGGDALPLLAFTLRELYEATNTESYEILHRDYDALGTVVGAMRRQADRVMEEAARQGKGDLVLPLLLKLVSLDPGREPTRRRLERASLLAGENVVADAFIDARLLVSGAESGQPYLEVAHEALLRGWPPLAGAIDARRDELRLRTDLDRMAADWDAWGRSESYLASGDRLAAFLRWAQGNPQEANADATLRLFLGASVRRDKALSRRLADMVAARVLTGFEQDPELGILLSLAACEELGGSEKATQALKAAIAESRLRDVLQTNEGTVYSARWSPDGRLLALATQAGVVDLWSAANRHDRFALVATLREASGKPTYDVEWSRDGRRLVAASADGAARVWDVQSSALRLVIERRDSGPAVSAAFSPDGKTLAVAWSSGLVEVCDSATGERRVIVREPESASIRPQHRGSGADPRPALEDSERRPHVVYSADGRDLLTISPSGKVELWFASSSVAVAGPVASLRDSEPSPNWDASFSPDGARVVAAAENRTARIWEIHRDPLSLSDSIIWRADSNPKPGQLLTGHGGWVRTADFSRDGSRVATASDDGSARVWSASSGAELVRLRGHRARVFGARFSPDGGDLVSASEDGTARVWQLDVEETVIRASLERVRTALYSPDESCLVTASPDRTATVWQLTDRGPVSRSFLHPTSVHCACFSPSGDQIATASEDGIVRLWDRWDTSRPEPTYQLRGGSDWCRWVEYSADGSLLASSWKDGSTRVWALSDLTTDPVVLSAGDGSPVRSVSFSPDGRLLATGSDRGSIWVWDISRPGDSIWCVPEGHRTWITTVAFSRDGGRLVSASGDDTARVWDAAAGTLLLELPHLGQESVRAACFSGDGKRVVTGTGDGVVSVWDASDGARLAVMRGHGGPVSTSVYSRDGLRILTASDDGTARIWRDRVASEAGLGLDQLTRLAHERVFRDLTPDERRQYGLTIETLE